MYARTHKRPAVRCLAAAGAMALVLSICPAARGQESTPSVVTEEQMNDPNWGCEVHIDPELLLAPPDGTLCGLRGIEDEDCYIIANQENTTPYQRNNALRGIRFRMHEPRRLLRIRAFLGIPQGVDVEVWYEVYEKRIGEGSTEWEKLFEDSAVFNKIGTQIYAHYDMEVLPGEIPPGLLLDSGTNGEADEKEFMASFGWAEQDVGTNVIYWWKNQPAGTEWDFDAGVVTGSFASCYYCVVSFPLAPVLNSSWEYADRYAMDLCFDPAPGACCYPDNTCAEVKRADCAGAGGQYTADGFPCDDPDPFALDVMALGGCPLPIGACCIEDPAAPCEDINEVACQFDRGGTFKGVGGSCALDACTGACCVYHLGECVDALYEHECIGSDLDPHGLNTWYGAGARCDDGDVQADCVDLGACCPWEGGVCLQVTEAECTEDIWRGVGVPCDPSPCALDHRGACCLYDSTCMNNKSPYDCEFVYEGLYQGDGSVCTGVTCEVLGSCCLSNNSCGETSQFICEDILFGTWTADQRCDPNPCKGPLGACCMDGACALDNQIDCLAAGGTYQGAGTDCVTNPCPPEGACCLDDLGCDVVTQAACNSLTGDYAGDGTHCFDCSLTGACCLPDSTCGDLTAGDCFDATGIFKGAGTSCSTPGICDDLCSPFPGEGNGDYTGDGVADGQDTPAFVLCMTAPGVASTLECRCAFDFDLDLDVDLFDFGAYQSVFCTGDGDYNDDTYVDVGDYVALADCMAGVDVPPAPTTHDATMCLCAFDADRDGDIDLEDFSGFQVNFSP